MEDLKSLLGRKKSRNAAATSSSSAAISRSHSRRSDRSNAQIIEELEKVFKKFDVNGDGKICSSELGSIMRSLGEDLTESELKIMIEEVDSDGDGFIDLKEFIELDTKGFDADDFEQNLREAFSVYDIDGNGSISAEEYSEGDTAVRCYPHRLQRIRVGLIVYNLVIGCLVSKCGELESDAG
ncbi:hypothetical protein Drorol1_Dr00014217 [Drosera rotundifolia]